MKVFLNNYKFNTDILESYLGSSKYSMFASYIVVDIDNGQWWATPEYQWLYVDKPNVITIDEFISEYFPIIRQNRINLILE